MYFIAVNFFTLVNEEFVSLLSNLNSHRPFLDTSILNDNKPTEISKK
jgi:hypothetical protein